MLRAARAIHAEPQVPVVGMRDVALPIEETNFDIQVQEQVAGEAIIIDRGPQLALPPPPLVPTPDQVIDPQMIGRLLSKPDNKPILISTEGIGGEGQVQRCNRCNRDKSREEFNLDRAGIRQKICRSCLVSNVLYKVKSSTEV